MMDQMTPRRCPFLQGNINSEMFGGVTANPKRDFQCDFLMLCFNLGSDVPVKYGCLNGKFLSCQHYSRRVLELAITMALTCPLKREESDECTATNKVCEMYWISFFDEWAEDYRECTVFAKWFWSTKMRKRKLGQSVR